MFASPWLLQSPVNPSQLTTGLLLGFPVSGSMTGARAPCKAWLILVNTAGRNNHERCTRMVVGCVCVHSVKLDIPPNPSKDPEWLQAGLQLREIAVVVSCYATSCSTQTG